jgi:hypothetical protein
MKDQALLREQFEESLADKIEAEIERTRDEREERLADAIEERMRERFEDSLMMPMKLYHVTSRVRELGGCKNVRLNWFYDGKRTERRPYTQLIIDYDPDDEHQCPESAIDETFTEDEALQLKTFLDEYHGHDTETEIVEMELPIPNNLIGVCAISYGGGVEKVCEHKKEEYPLPFKASAHCRLIGCEKVDGSGIYHGYHYRVMPDGTVKKEEKPAP